MICILGGTFDPVHNAHLAIARRALEVLVPDRILWIPTGPTAYRSPALADASHRIAMLELALAGEPRYVLDLRELRPQASGYTIDTLRALHEELPAGARLVLLLGADQYAKLPTWHRWRELLDLCRIAVFARPGFDPQEAAAQIVPMEPMAISASDIRARVARGEDVTGMVPAPVANYIARHKLYA